MAARTRADTDVVDVAVPGITVPDLSPLGYALGFVLAVLATLMVAGYISAPKKSEYVLDLVSLVWRSPRGRPQGDDTTPEQLPPRPERSIDPPTPLPRARPADPGGKRSAAS